MNARGKKKYLERKYWFIITL